MSSLEKGSMLMSTVSSFQMTQKERAGVSTAEKEFTCMEHNVLCDRRPAKGSLKQATFKENRLGKHGNGRICLFFQQHAANKRESILIF